MAKRHKKHTRRTARRSPGRKLFDTELSQRSQSAYDRALHVLAAMRREPQLSLFHAARLQGVKPSTVQKYFSSALRKTDGKFIATKSDSFAETVYVPDVYGNPVPVPTNSFKQRKQASAYLRDLGRYLGGDRNALSKWHGKRIAGVQLVTAGRTIVAIEPALSEFSLYRVFNGGAA